jgi:hypothetical protein
MSKEKGSKEKGSKKVALKSLKEKRATKLAKKDEKNHIVSI